MKSKIRYQQQFGKKPKVVLLHSSKNNMQVVSSHDPILTNQKTILHHECNYNVLKTLKYK